MDELTKELQTFLVRMRYQPESVSHTITHNMEHLVRLLDADDEEAVLHYFGILGYEQLSLNEIAQERKLSPEDMMALVDRLLRRLAITPEWQMMKQAL